MERFVIQCIARDPRWDWQVESRADYYALLILARDLAIGPLVGRLWMRDGRSQERSTTALIIDTLGRLAVRGHAGARTVLRDYLSWGVWWDIAFRHLAEARLLSGLEPVLERRFPGEELVRGLAGMGVEPWEIGVDPVSAVGRILSMHRARRDEDRVLAAEARANTEELLDEAGTGLRIVDELVRRDERRLLRARAVRWDRSGACAALVALARLGDSTAFPEAVALLKQPTLLIPVRLAARAALLQLPAPLVRPLAVEWFESPRHCLRRTAEEALERCATSEDVPMLTDALASASAAGDGHRIGSIAVALTVTGESAVVPWLEEIFATAEYAFARKRATCGLAALSGPFPLREAVEGLWDAEPDVRALSASHAMRCRRLRELAEDRFEDASVRSAVRGRLNG